MSKGSDSKEFFELFKAAQNEQNVQNKEATPVTESADVSQQQKPPISEDTSVKKPSVSADLLGWIKNTRKEDTVFKGKVETSTVSQPISAAPKNVRNPRKDEIVLRQETLIIGAIAATFLSIACFFVGHKFGYNKGLMSRTEEWAEAIEPRNTKNTGLGQSRVVEAPQKATNKAVSQRIEKLAEQSRPQDAKNAGVGQPKLIEIPQKAANKAAPQKMEKQIEKPKSIKDKWTLRVISYKNTKENIEKAKEVAKMIQDTLGYDAFVVNTGKELFICAGEFEVNDSPDLISAQKALAELDYQNKKQFAGCYPIRIK